MRQLTRLGLALVLTLTVVLSVFGGETQSPPCAPGETQSPPCALAPLGTGDSTVPREITTDPRASYPIDLKTLVEVTLTALLIL